MVKKLVKHGNSLALVIDKPVLDLLKIGPDTPLEIITDGSALVISPASGGKRHKEFEKALEKVGKKHSRLFKRLAE